MRKAVGIQAKDLARLLQRTPETVSRWENGRGEIEPLAWLLLDALVHDKYDEVFQDAKLPRRSSRELLEALGHKPRRLSGIVPVMQER